MGWDCYLRSLIAWLLTPTIGQLQPHPWRGWVGRWWDHLPNYKARCGLEVASSKAPASLTRAKSSGLGGPIAARARDGFMTAIVTLQTNC